jgi:hypothetical protein
MSKWTEYFRCRKDKKMENNLDLGTGAISAGTTLASGSVIPGNITGAYGYSTLFGPGQFSHPYAPTNIISLSHNSAEIVRLNIDGSVTWNNEINIDEAAEAFGKALGIGAELAVGINKRVKTNMRDSVFEDLINIAKEKGSLTAEDLTYLLQASKIMENLKGGRE